MARIKVTRDTLKNAAHAVARTAARLVQGKEALVMPEEHRRRMNVCERCPEYLEQSRQCGKCTCFISLKCALVAEQCPLNKW